MSELADRNVRMSPELMERWATRDLDGRRLSWSWGEPDADGFYTPTITTHDDDRLGELDAAWAEAEAALPEGRWVLTGLVRRHDGGWRATAGRKREDGEPFPPLFGDDPVWRSAEGLSETNDPAAALRALAAKLRESAG